MERYTIKDTFLNYTNQSTILEILQYELINTENGLQIDLSNFKQMDSIGMSVFIILFRKALNLTRKLNSSTRHKRIR